MERWQVSRGGRGHLKQRTIRPQEGKHAVDEDRTH
jgi:hypothetical protein